MKNYQFEILSHGGGLCKLPANQVLYKGDNRGNVNILFSLHVNMSDIMIPLHISWGYMIIKTTPRYLLA